MAQLIYFYRCSNRILRYTFAENTVVLHIFLDDTTVNAFRLECAVHMLENKCEVSHFRSDKNCTLSVSCDTCLPHNFNQLIN